MYAEQAHLYDHRHWILDRFLRGREKNPRWSLRAFAKRLGISHSALSEIISGKRALSQKSAKRLAERLDLSLEETQSFLRAAWTAQLESRLANDEAINQLRDRKFLPLDLRTFRVIAEWYHYAILSLLEIDGIDPRPKPIAERLGISPKEATEALRRLEALKIIKKGKAGYLPPTETLSTYTQGYDVAMRNFLRQHLEKATRSLETDPAELREFSVTTMAVDPKNLPKARELVKRFRREMSDLLEKGKKQRVYSVAVQVFPLDGKNEETK